MAQNIFKKSYVYFIKVYDDHSGPRKPTNFDNEDAVVFQVRLSHKKNKSLHSRTVKKIVRKQFFVCI